MGSYWSILRWEVDWVKFVFYILFSVIVEGVLRMGWGKIEVREVSKEVWWKWGVWIKVGEWRSRGRDRFDRFREVILIRNKLIGSKDKWKEELRVVFWFLVLIIEWLMILLTKRKNIE